MNCHEIWQFHDKALVHFGRFLRTVFCADYFTNAFFAELPRVLNRRRGGQRAH
jgi:hypothetical protein